MRNEDIELAFKNFEKKDAQLRKDMKDLIRVILEEVEDHVIDFPDCPAYCVDDNGQDYYEVPIYGVMLHDGALEVSLALDGDYTDWSDADYIRTEYNHHCTINWLEVLDSIRLITK